MGDDLRSDDDSELREEVTELNRWGDASRAPAHTHPRVRWSDAEGQHTLVLSGRTLCGSARGAGVVIADRTVSRMHCELEEIDGFVWIRDLGSRNGTFVEGVLVGSARVPDGGRVTVGSTDLRVTYDAEPPERQLWPDAQFGPMVGNSRVMRELFAQLARVAATDSSVLVRGETGTGKELVAKAIHDASRRAEAPFVVLDCGALPEHLLEAELFGHARGAFTGATHDRIGAFEAAAGGTIFLDEVGELPLAMQPKLLRVIESRTIRRLGEIRHRPVDVRVLSATHRDLRTMVNAGAFREDLYFRLAVLPIVVPPLRERPDDIRLLIDHFLPPSSSSVPAALLQDLATRPWLGNVRELRNFVERAIAFGPAEALAMAHDVAGDEAPPRVTDESDFDHGFRTFRERWIERGEREYVERQLRAHGGVVSAAATAAGLDRTYFYKMMRRHGIVPRPPR